MEREKVIKGLHDIGGFIAGRVGFEQAKNFMRTIDEAVALLKEQEAVAPSTSHHLFICPVCKTTLKREQKFCHECGQEVKWE